MQTKEMPQVEEKATDRIMELSKVGVRWAATRVKQKRSLNGSYRMTLHGGINCRTVCEIFYVFNVLKQQLYYKNSIYLFSIIKKSDRI